MEPAVLSLPSPHAGVIGYVAFGYGVIVFAVLITFAVSYYVRNGDAVRFGCMLAGSTAFALVWVGIFPGLVGTIISGVSLAGIAALLVHYLNAKKRKK